MKNVKPTPRHRKARRPLSPVVDLAGAITSTVSPYAARTTAVASATGLALTAMVTMTANAAQVAQVDGAAKAAPTATVKSVATKVATADIAWSVDALDDVTATAEPAPPEPVVVEPVAQAATAYQAASRDTVRETPVNVPASSTSAVVNIAMQYLGVPYVYGGTSPSGFDCSGLTQYVYAQVGISLPRIAQSQGYAGTVIPVSEAQPGDLVWYRYGHAAIYIGNGQMIHAPHPGDVVKIAAVYGSPEYVRF